MQHPDSGQYFAEDPSVASSPTTVRLALADMTLDLVVDRGVFSAGRVDPGTRYLLGAAAAPPGVRVAADVGCGYGPIAVTLARRCPDAVVWAVDTNRRARELCAQNALGAGCRNVRVAAPDEVPEDLAVDLIWSNPPIRIGKAALHTLLEGWLDRLTPDGKAILVVQWHLGSDSLARHLTGKGWDVARLGSRTGYRLLEVGRG